MPNATATILYDATCPLCQNARAWIEARAMAGQFTFVPCTSEARAALRPQVSEADCLQAMHLLPGDGSALRGASAVAAILRVLPAWRTIGQILSLPVLSTLAAVLYRQVARRRLALSAFFTDKSSATACDSERGCR